MLQDLRDQKNSWLIAVLFGVIILVFIFMFGMPGTDLFVNKTNPDVAKVGSHKISYDVYRSMIYRYRGDDIYNAPDYPAQARMIAEGVGVIYLLADAAREAGLRVSDEELHDYITNWESGNNDILRLGFLNKNKFSQRNYNDALSRMQLSARDYEDFKREELLARRYMTLMMSSISVSDESLWQDYAIANAAADLEVVRLTSSAVGATFKNLTTEEIANFVERDKDKIEAYYNEHLGDYTTPAKAKLHQIVIQKHYAKLTNPGEKTIKTNQPTERFAIVKNQVLNEHLDFAQAFTDYDESEDKELKGVTGLLSIEIMAEPIQKAIEGKAVGEVVTAELSDRFVIA
ncbi:MAG: SurA N-terminal domain-containing protein, partial [Proteobacteria bacterium]|nr:SurA N-terminal domain-containing protein [Pseudomonadota bacterium]